MKINALSLYMMLESESGVLPGEKVYIIQICFGMLMQHTE